MFHYRNELNFGIAATESERGRNEGKMKSEFSRNWNYPKKSPSGDMSLTPRICPFPFQQQGFYHQPCLETAERLQVTITVQPCHPDRP